MASVPAPSVAEEFRAFILNVCGSAPDHVVADGRWHSFRMDDTRHKGSRPGRYLLHNDERPVGWVMDWRDEKVRHRWFGKGSGETLDREEVIRRRNARDMDRLRGFQAAADDAKAFWAQCRPISEVHPYLECKGVAPYRTRQGSGARFGLGDVPCVIIPIADAEGRALTLQAIREDGERRFWPGSTHEGGHHLIGTDDGQSPIIFCEGYSTAATLHAATGFPVVMTINTSNMAHVARWASHRWAGRDMIVAADDDWHLVDHPKAKRNVGKEAAEAMARTLGGRVVMPDMAGLVTDGGDDFNDMAREIGMADVAALFTAPAPATEKLVNATPFTWRATADIPKRRWLYGKHLLRGFVSVDVAAGGVGKSSLKIGEALAMATGRDLYDKGLHEGALNVWLWNLEDPVEEIERRLHATAQRFKISPQEVGSRLYVDSGRDQPLVIATEGPDGAVIARPVVDALITEMQERKIDVLVVDPFISSHAVSENDNNAIDIVAREWNIIAERTGAAINLVHHVRKQNGAEATADSARGASSLIGKARSVLVYNRMSDQEAVTLNVPAAERFFHFRVDNDKANLAPAERGDWYRMNNVDLANGDSVGVACSWTPPDAFAGVTTAHLIQMQRAISDGKWRKDQQAKAWAGHALAGILNLDFAKKEEKAKAKQIIDRWVREGVLEVVIDHDEKRNEREFIIVGKWVTE